MRIWIVCYLIPSEETRLVLYPLDFEEFLWATGKDAGVSFLKMFYEKKMPLGPAHRNTLRDLRLYMLIGGMLQSINTYLQTNNLQQVDNVKREILALYDDDFRKIDPRGSASRLLRSIPWQLSSNARRYQLSHVLEGQKPKNIESIIADMEDSMVVNFAYHTSDPNVGMGLYRNPDNYKMYLHDTGLFVTLAFWDKAYTDNVIYTYVYENLVAQMLRTAGN